MNSDLLLKKICYRALTCICSLPPTNPVALQALKFHTHPAKRHITNIQYLLKLYQFDTLSIENIPVMTKPPSYKLPIVIVITNSKEESLEDESKDEANIRIYTDGSCQNRKVSAAAVLYYSRNGAILTPSRLL